LFSHSTPGQNTTRDLDVVVCLDCSFDPLQFVLLDQVWFATGWEGPKRITFAGDWVHLEPALTVGAKLGSEEPVSVFVLNPSCGQDNRARDWLAGVRGQDAPFDDPGRFQRDRDFLGRCSVVRPNIEILPTVAEVSDVQADEEIAADTGEEELALVVRDRRLWPGSDILGRAFPERSSVAKPHGG
jgi:hypothetical protein